MRRVALSLVLGLLGVGLLTAAMAVAAPVQPLAASPTGGPLFDDDDPDAPTGAISPTTTTTHPVASAIADFFEVNYSVIKTLHDEGYGFGVIAKAYFISEKLKDTVTPMTPEEVLAFFESGLGWGEILKQFDLHPGLAGRGGNLGSIMSRRNKGADWMPPGQSKKSLSPSGDGGAFTPPGQLKKSGRDGAAGGERGGPPFTPPGHAKEKGKDKGKK